MGRRRPDPLFSAAANGEYFIQHWVQNDGDVCAVDVERVRLAIADCADLRIVPILPRHPLCSRRFVPATSAHSCPSRPDPIVRLDRVSRAILLPVLIVSPWAWVKALPRMRFRTGPVMCQFADEPVTALCTSCRILTGARAAFRIVPTWPPGCRRLDHQCARSPFVMSLILSTFDPDCGPLWTGEWACETSAGSPPVAHDRSLSGRWSGSGGECARRLGRFVRQRLAGVR
jgi:hypothetical protein